MNEQTFNPGAIRYIKLGRGGGWAEQALRVGYRAADHAACIAGDWEAVRAALIERYNRTAAGASQGVREVREFYNLPENTL